MNLFLQLLGGVCLLILGILAFFGVLIFERPVRDWWKKRKNRRRNK